MLNFKMSSIDSPRSSPTTMSDSSKDEASVLARTQAGVSMTDDPDQPPVEQTPELQLLMPHEYRIRDAAIDSIKNNRIFSAILVLIMLVMVSFSMTKGVREGLVMLCSWLFFSMVLLGYSSLGQLDRERRRREVFLLERASLKRGADSDAIVSARGLPFPRRIVVRVWPVLRHNKIPLLGGVLLILPGMFLSIAMEGFQSGIECSLSGLVLLGLAGGLLLVKEVVKPSEEIRREIEANQTLRRLTSEKERVNLKGSLSMDTGATGDEVAGGLSMSQEQGAISSVERDPEG